MNHRDKANYKESYFVALGGIVLLTLLCIFMHKATAQPPLYSFGLTITRLNQPAVNAVVSTTTKAECDWVRERAIRLMVKALVPGRGDTYGADPEIKTFSTTPACRVGP